MESKNRLKYGHLTKMKRQINGKVQCFSTIGVGTKQKPTTKSKPYFVLYTEINKMIISQNGPQIQTSSRKQISVIKV